MSDLDAMIEKDKRTKNTTRNILKQVRHTEKEDEK
jgi:hypothetical protein